MARLELRGEGDLIVQISPDVEARAARRYFVFRGIAERIVAVLALIPASPLIALLVLIVRWNSPGPGLFRQLRVGRNGHPFMMYKLRSMRQDAEARTGPVWSQRGDARVTPLGAWLRKTHFDELPQLFNVALGQMSFVGPRPERPEFVSMLSEQVTDYMDRLAILPGITGIAQINLPPDSDLDSVRRKNELDREYIRTAGPWLDFRIVVCTAFRFVGIGNERIAALLGLTRTVHLPALNPVPSGSIPSVAKATGQHSVPDDEQTSSVAIVSELA